MATQQQYAAATVAVLKILQADIDKDVPAIFRGSISPDVVQQIAADTAKAAVDAAEGEQS